MPERFTITCDADRIQQRFDLATSEGYIPRYNAAPAQLLPVITQSEPAGFSFFYWGSIPVWTKNKNISNRLLTVTADQLLKKANHRQALRTHRCIVPADGWFEWKQLGKKTKIPYRIAFEQEKIMSFAGLWEEFEDEKDELFHIFRLITIPANTLVGEFSGVMPALLNKDDEKIWLDKQTTENELIALLQPLSMDKMMSYTVSPRISDTNQDSPDLIKRVAPADQFGNFSLFD
ncbi:MAG: SOS response-associated peptidase [Cyclobacteriaceae bacterium]|nr:SOS response-associated peptidase [Cyclobacteriaceae bacterium]